LVGTVILEEEDAQGSPTNMSTVVRHLTIRQTQRKTEDTAAYLRGKSSESLLCQQSRVVLKAQIISSYIWIVLKVKMYAV